tara:strand:+ start:1671 stop:2075 length:405 start_codon:yes stop_codon:yes gene_type:complete
MKKIILIILSTSLFATVTNDATLTIDSDVNVIINTDLVNTGIINNNGGLQVNGFYDGTNGTLNNNGSYDSYTSGDVNGDNIINVYDVVIVVSYLFGTYTESNDEFFSTSDINQDGGVNVSDIVIIINLIFAQPL